MQTKILDPKVSVIMPVYNAGKYLRESIDSILNQSFSDFEMFIIDDKSTDDSLDIIKSYNDNRIILIEKEKNTGYTDSLNMAIKLAKGKYIARMDADDIAVKDRFLKQYTHMEQNPELVLLGTLYQIIGKDRIFQYPGSYEEIKVFALTQNPVPHPTAFIRSSILSKHNLFYDRTYEPAEDFELWTKMIEVGKVENLQEVCLHYRQHEGQISNTKREIQIKAADKIRTSQIEKLILFQKIPLEKEFILNVLTKRVAKISASELVDLKKLLEIISTENRTRKLYDSVFLENFLRSVWEKYVYSVYDYNIGAITSIMPSSIPTITKMSLMFKLKFVAKCLIKRK